MLHEERYSSILFLVRALVMSTASNLIGALLRVYLLCSCRWSFALSHHSNTTHQASRRRELLNLLQREGRPLMPQQRYVTVLVKHLSRVCVTTRRLRMGVGCRDRQLAYRDGDVVVTHSWERLFDMNIS